MCACASVFYLAEQTLLCLLLCAWHVCTPKEVGRQLPEQIWIKPELLRVPSHAGKARMISQQRITTA